MKPSDLNKDGSLSLMDRLEAILFADGDKLRKSVTPSNLMQTVRSYLRIEVLLKRSGVVRDKEERNKLAIR